LFVIRTLGLYLPIGLAILAWRRQTVSRRAATGVMLAGIWNFVALIGVNILALSAGWWRYEATGPLLAGVPLDLLLGWTVLWGVVAPLAAPRAPIAAVALAAALVDVLVMPLCAPVVHLGDAWLAGEAVAIAIALVPGLLLARWTVEDRHLGARAAFQMICFAALVLGVLPETILAHTSGSWSPLTDAPTRTMILELQLVAVPALLGVSALQEFVQRGRGTPLPFDPPRHLVTTGPYAYVANPMQLSAAVLLFAWGAVLHSWWIALGGVMGWIYSVGLARMDEGVDLEGRFGTAWVEYRRAVRNWIPRWRPAPAPARLYVAMSCGPCSEVARWFSASGAVALEVAPAESHPNRDLRRITYELVGAPDSTEEGVAAIARAVEHINFAWAMVGFLARLPVVGGILQLLADVSGGEERLVERRPQPLCPTAEGLPGALNVRADATSTIATGPRRIPAHSPMEE
jgi:protein-S-isoprenylcysteine O-methyltransferase Ste14